MQHGVVNYFITPDPWPAGQRFYAFGCAVELVDYEAHYCGCIAITS